MSATLSCAGLPTGDDELTALIDRVLPVTQLLGLRGINRVVRWEDPSGARLVLEVGADGVVDLLPSFRSGSTVLLAGLHKAGDVLSASLLDRDGEQWTSACLELEQPELPPQLGVTPLPATLTALGVDIEIFPDADAFAASDASLLDPDSPAGEAPESYREQGWSWPPRVAATSFFSYGVFAEAEDATAHARLSGTVLRAERRVVRATGQEVVVVDVETPGGELTVCLEGAVHPGAPPRGSVLSGTVFLVACLQEPPQRRRRFWSRRG